MKTIICAIIKNEERYIKEWADYHLNTIGIDRIFLFEDYDSRNHQYIFEDEPRVTINTLENFGIPNHRNAMNQFELYKKFLIQCKNESQYDWIFFIDIDEFITFEDGYNLGKIEEEYKDIPTLLLSWMNYGANGHIKRPEGGVLENYTKPGVVCESDSQWAKKSLVNVKLCKGLKTIHIFKGNIDVEGNADEHADLIYKKIWLNHYFTKSWEDFCERMFNRGNMQNDFRTLDNFFACNPDMIDRDKELIESVRYLHCNDTQWLSRKYKLISGGKIRPRIK